MEDEKDNVEVLSDVLKDLKINGKNNQVQTLEKTSAFYNTILHMIYFWWKLEVAVL